MTDKEILGLSTKENFAAGHRACGGCGAALAARLILKAAGDDVIVCGATGCMEVFSTPFPQSAWKVPWIHAAFENAPAVASGVESALRYSKKKTKVLVLGGDGSSFDIGFQALSGAVERGHDFLYICYDNNAYMNTGIQRSSATPQFADTRTSFYGKKIHGKVQKQKPLTLIMAAHGAYVATASIAFPQDFAMKIKKGLEVNGPAFIHVYAPCPKGWYFDSSQTVNISKVAFDTGVTPLYEVKDGLLKFTKKPAKLDSITKFTKPQGRFKKMSQDELKKMQELVRKNIAMLEDFEKKKIRLSV